MAFVLNKRNDLPPPIQEGSGDLLYCVTHGQGVALRDVDREVSNARICHHHCVVGGGCFWERQGVFMFVDGEMIMRIPKYFQKIQEDDCWKTAQTKTQTEKLLRGKWLLSS